MVWPQAIGDSGPREEVPPFAPGTGLAEREPKPTHTQETVMYRLTTTMMVLAMALGFQSAHAAPPKDLLSVLVRFGDLDLSRTEGAKVLYQRLKGAAETVCAPLDSRDLARRTGFKECMQTAISTAVAKVDQPTLTAYYVARTSGRNATIQIAQK